MDSRNYFTKDYFFRRNKSNYSNYYKFDNDRYWNPVVNKVKRYKLSGKVLDVGCAFGFFLKRISPYFNEMHGIDISSFALKEARVQAPSAKYKILDISEEMLPFPDEYFDVITALDVLEHTESFEKALRKIVKKLKKNGYIFVTVPLRGNLVSNIMRKFDKDKSHISVLQKNKLFELFNLSELEIVEQSCFLGIGFFKLRGIPVNIEVVLRKI